MAPSNGAEVQGAPEVQEQVTCNLCGKIMYEPKTLPCQHSFCHRCLYGWSKKANLVYGLQCPSCGKAFTGLALTDVFLDQKVMLLQRLAGIFGSNESSLPPSQIMSPVFNQNQNNQSGSPYTNGGGLNSDAPRKGILKSPHPDNHVQFPPGSTAAKPSNKSGLSALGPGLGSSDDDDEEELLAFGNNTPGLHSGNPGGFDFSDDEDDEESDLSNIGNDVGGLEDLISSSDEDLLMPSTGFPGGNADGSDQEDSESDPEDSNIFDLGNAPKKVEVVQEIFDDAIMDERFEDIFLKSLRIVKTLDLQHKKELKETFIHDMSMTRDGNLFVVDLNNNIVKCCDPQGLTLKKSPNKLLAKPIRFCELYTGELLVVEMQKGGKVSCLQRSLSNKDLTHKDPLKMLKKACVVRQMPEDRARFYCGDSEGYIHRLNLKALDSYVKFHSALPRIYHMAAANGLIAVNDGIVNGETSKTVRIINEEGDLQWSYSGTKQHPFVYHGDMVFHGDYLIICDFWANKLHLLFMPNEAPAKVMSLERDLGLCFPSSILVSPDHSLVLAAQQPPSKKTSVYTIEYLA